MHFIFYDSFWTDSPVLFVVVFVVVVDVVVDIVVVVVVCADDRRGWGWKLHRSVIMGSKLKE